MEDGRRKGRGPALEFFGTEPPLTVLSNPNQEVQLSAMVTVGAGGGMDVRGWGMSGHRRRRAGRESAVSRERTNERTCRTMTLEACLTAAPRYRDDTWPATTGP